MSFLLGLATLALVMARGSAGVVKGGDAGRILLGATFATAGALLVFLAVSGQVGIHGEAIAARWLRWSTATTVASYQCIAVGIAMHPGSNLPGLIGLLAAPLYWASILVTFVAVLGWIACRVSAAAPRRNA